MILTVISRFHETLQAISLKLYQFAHTLLPDDLQAQQLVIDAVSAFMLKEDQKIAFVALDEIAPKSVRREQLLNGILPFIFDIGSKRFFQLETQLKDVMLRQKNHAYYQLDTISRAVVFLKYRWNYSFEEVADTLKIPVSQVIERLYAAKPVLIEEGLMGRSAGELRERVI